MYELRAPDDWTPYSVYDLATWKNGLAFKNIEFSQIGDPVIKIAELKQGIGDQTKFTQGTFAPDVRVNPGDMLFSWSGNPDTSIDVFEWSGQPGWLNQHIFKVSPADVVDRDFLFFLLKWLKPRFAEIARNKQTTGLGHVTLADFRQMRVGLPNTHEQKRIVQVVKPYQDKIELNRRTNETLEAMARALFKDWFVDFGPTRAKIEGRAPYLAPDLWSLFPDRLNEETGLPEGWRSGTLSDVANTNVESWTTRNHPDEVEYVDLSNTKWGNIETISRLAWGEAPSRARRIARAGDTIVGTTRPGNGSFAYVSRDGLTASTGFAVLTPRAPEYRDITYIAATRPENIARLANLADGHGGAYPAVNANEVSETELPLADDTVFLAFSGCVAPLREKIERAKEESRTLAQTRDLLLPKLMSGEIRLREMEGVV